MTRIIKFRAWDGNSMAYYPELKNWNTEYCNLDEDGVILMQYTGLKDKNGNEIYEGDILISKFGDGSPTQICFGEFTCATYETKDLATEIGFYWNELDGTKSIFGKSVDGNMEYCEVIGNIYENPELLKP